MDVRQRLLLLLMLKRKRRRYMVSRRRHRFWVKEIFQKRHTLGEFNLHLEMYFKDEESFHQCYRMNREQFDYIVSKVGPLIQKCDVGREVIGIQERLAVTLRYNQQFVIESLNAV